MSEFRPRKRSGKQSWEGEVGTVTTLWAVSATATHLDHAHPDAGRSAGHAEV